MFDLTQELSLDAPKSSPSPQASASHSPETTSLEVSVLFQTQQCKALIEEACRFEGWREPSCYKQSLDKIKALELGAIVIIELCGCDDLIAQAERINSLIPNGKAVIIIGDEDKIYTLRELEQRGFYYLLWPATKHDITNSLNQASQYQQRLITSGHFRQAKRIALIGSRGGVGTSLMTTELTAALAKKGSRAVLVDHHFDQSNIDILLSRKDLEQTDLNTITVELAQIDGESASNYLSEIETGFMYLGLTGDAKPDALENCTTTLTDKLVRHANFIVEDYSASVDFPLDLQRLVKQCDIIVLLIEPSVSAVRSAQSLIDKINQVGLVPSERPRLLTVLNHQRPMNSYNLTAQEVEKFIKQPLDITVPFYKQAATQLITGKRLSALEKGRVTPFTDLAKLVNGEVEQRSSGLWSKWFKRGTR